MKFSQKKVVQASKIIRKHRLISDRVEELKANGFNVVEKPMGPGGVYQIKKLRSEIRMQISYGHGKNNYAQCIIFSH